MEKANKNLLERTISSSFDEAANCNKVIEDCVKGENFNSLNFMQGLANELMQTIDYNELRVDSYLENAELISLNVEATSPYTDLISEKEFLRIVGFNKNKLSARSGLYQERLYGHYLEAKAQKDIGYIADVLKKAIEFRDNLEFVKKLSRRKSFMKKWKADCIETPLQYFKRTGHLRNINMIQFS